MQHRKTVRHYHDPGDLHEFTFSCYGQRPLLTNDRWRVLLSRSIDAAGEAEAFELVAFVFMPEHVHLLTNPRRRDPDLDRYLALVKQPVSRQIRETLEACGSRLLNQLTVLERPGKTCFRFWQEGPGYDRNLHSRAAIQAAIDYIHLNPVRRGLSQKAVDWRWSSARYYLASPEKQQFSELPHVHGLPPGALDET